MKMQRGNYNITISLFNFKSVQGVLYMLFALCTAIIGHHIHGSIGWSIIDYIFAPIAWVKWLICQEVNLTIIHESFAFFLK